MQFQFTNLDWTTRILMLDELRRDAVEGTVFTSRRLSDEGRAVFEALLAAVLARGDIDELAHQLGQCGRLVTTETRRTKTGQIEVSVPKNAARMLAESAFNHYYARAIARRALTRGDETVEVYRAKRVAKARPESEARVGSRIDPLILLADLRGEKHHGIPAGPNSGLSVRLVRPQPVVEMTRSFHTAHVARPTARRVPWAGGSVVLSSTADLARPASAVFGGFVGDEA